MFKNKHYIVTGGGSGIGRQITMDLVSEGAIVFILGRNKKTLEKTSNSNIIPIDCDVSLYDKVEKAFDGIDCIDGLVNNAGINLSRKNIVDTKIEDWQDTLDTNLTGAFNCSKEAIKKMTSGSIVNIGSVAGLMGARNKISYMVSKAGMIGLTKSLAMDFAKSNIRVNCVCPAYLSEGLPSKYLNKMSDKEYKKVIEQHPLGRLGTFKDVSNMVLFLLSDKSNWITGTIIPVDGGYSCGKEY